MGLLGFLFMDALFFDKSESKPKPSSSWSSRDDYDDYYEELHGDAMAGDSSARREMEAEFGDDWEGEY